MDLLLSGRTRKEELRLSRNVVSADGVVGWLPRDSSGVSLDVGGALTDLSRSGVGDGRDEGSVSGKYLDLFPSVRRQEETVAVSCDDRPDEGRREARSMDWGV
jgi:hypothetical protein